MKKSFEELLEKEKGQFPLEEMPNGHFERFQYQWNATNRKSVKIKPYMGVAASIILLLSLLALWQLQKHQDSTQNEMVESYKPESLKSSEQSIALTVHQQRKEILSTTSKNYELVHNTLLELNRLEQEYQKMEEDLVISGNEKVITAMHHNLELRTQILAKTQKYLQHKTP